MLNIPSINHPTKDKVKAEAKRLFKVINQNNICKKFQSDFKLTTLLSKKKKKCFSY